MKKISVVIPALNEEDHIRPCLASVQALRRHGHEVIVVDGGSDDATCDLATGFADQIISHPRGRACQMNHGAQKASGEIFLFLHADTCLPEHADLLIGEKIKDSPVYWGRFKVRLSGTHWLFRITEILMNTRTRITGIVTGDHVLFISKELFEQVGGYPALPLMEDIAISKKINKIVPPICLNQHVVTSSRRWEQHGIIKTVLKMWWFRLAFFFGTDPARLSRQYD